MGSGRASAIRLAYDRRFAVAGAVTLLVVILAAVNRLDTLHEGLTATYFSDVDWSSAPVRSAIESQPSTDSLDDAWAGSPPPAFSATWLGSVIIGHDGPYTFATTSDGGSWVYVDGRQVVDNGGRHPVRLASGSLGLARGVHEIFVTYVHDGDQVAFQLSWARDGGPLESVPAWALSSRHREFSRVLASVASRRAFRAAAWLWLGTLVVVICGALGQACRRWIDILERDPTRRTLALVIGGSVVLNVLGIWWGIPGAWVGDELTPPWVLDAISQRFSGGWFHRYPPFHFYVLSAAFSPWLLMRSLHWIHASDRALEEAFFILGRLVSVAAGAGVLAGVYACGALAFGKRAGLLAAAMVALLSPFVYYAKTANVEVPYVFWFTASLFFYVRLIRSIALADIVLFTATATLAICTKDQAYALYLSVPFVIVYRLWLFHRDRRSSHPFLRAILDVRLVAAGLTAVALFVVIHNMVFNPHGFMNHMRDVTTSGRSYRLVEPTWGGQLALLGLTAGLNQRSWGWPLWLVSLIGLVIAVREKENRSVAICLALVMLSYYVGFIGVILYNYDRYLLPLCVVQALFGGVALDRVLGWQPQSGRSWRMALGATVFAYTLMYAATVDVLMIRDSRYAVEQWLHGHTDPDDLVATVFPQAVLPRLDGLRSVEIGTIDNLRRWAPAYFVLNADYARAVHADTPLGHLVRGLQDETLGYRLGLRYRSAAPWPWLPGAHPDLVGPRLDTNVLSILRDINPTIEVYVREARFRAGDRSRH